MPTSMPMEEVDNTNDVEPLEDEGQTHQAQETEENDNWEIATVADIILKV